MMDAVQERAESPVEAVPAGGSDVALIIVCAVLVVLAWGGLQLWGLGTAPFHTKGEPREGLVVWEMTHGGGWILPRRNGEELPSKPPLFHWLGAVTSLVRGATDEWSIRFPSAVLSLISLLCVCAAGAALWTPRAGLIGALALMTMFEWARAATHARVDMTLTFGLQLALLSLLFFLRRRAAVWLLPLYFGIAWAVLGKGPVGAALPGLVAVAMFGLTRDISPLRRMRLGAGTLGVGIIAGSWYVMALILGGYAFFRKQVLAENLFTFLDNPEFGGGHRHGVAYLFGVLMAGLVPWTIVLPSVIVRLWRQRRAVTLQDARVYLLVWIVVVFGFYAVAASKRGVYLLGLYPAVALLVGWWWDEQCRTPETDAWLARVVSGACWILLSVVSATFFVVLLEGLGAPLFAFAQPWLPDTARPMASWISQTIRDGRWPLLGLLLLGGAALAFGVRAARALNWGGIFAALFAAVAAVTLSIQQVALPGVAEHQTLRRFMADVRQVVGAGEPLFFYKALGKEFEYGAVFYSRRHIPIYAGSWPDGGPRYLLMQQTEWEQLEPEARAQYERVTLAAENNIDERRHLVLVRRKGAE